MRNTWLYALLVVVCATTVNAQAWRGQGRLQGVVTDQDGKPVANATVKLRAVRGSNTGPDVKTDAKGKWAALGLIGGAWDIDVEAEGFVPRRLSASVSEVERMPPMKIELERAAPPEPAPAEAKEVTMIGGKEVPADVVEAVERGNALLAESKFKEAATEYEKAVAVLSTNIQLKQALARAYHGSGELKKAITLLQDVHAAEPSNSAVHLLLVSMLVEDGRVEEAKTLFASLPAGSVTDSTGIINIAISLLNRNNAREAIPYLSKAIEIEPQRADGYYYRGLARMHLNQTKEAKADFRKVVELAPGSSEAKEANEILKSL